MRVAHKSYSAVISIIMALAFGLMVDVLSEGPAVSPIADVPDRPPVTTPQLDGQLFAQESNVPTAFQEQTTNSQQGAVSKQQPAANEPAAPVSN